MGDGNERNLLDEGFQARGKSNEERILGLEHDVYGRGGLFTMVEKLTAKIDELSGKIDTLDDKIDGIDNRLKNMERDTKDAKEARKPIVNEVLYVLGSLLVAAIIGLVAWFGRGGVR
jgi:tRNA/tmRNA/rRNA uracil-C5-methylase (TrmA/RlmC/RlmD family)